MIGRGYQVVAWVERPQYLCRRMVVGMFHSVSGWILVGTGYQCNPSFVSFGVVGLSVDPSYLGWVSGSVLWGLFPVGSSYLG